MVLSPGSLPSSLNSGVVVLPNSKGAKTWQLDNDEEEEEEKDENYEGSNDLY